MEGPQYYNKIVYNPNLQARLFLLAPSPAEFRWYLQDLLEDGHDRQGVEAGHKNK